MIRTQISLSKDDYDAAKREARRLGISLAELVIGEGPAWFARRFDVTRGLRFLAMIEAMKPLRTVSVGRREQAAGVQFL